MKNFLIVGLLCCYTAIYAQQTYNYPSDSIPSISITGTSTLHGWTVVAGEVTDFPTQLFIDWEEGYSIDSFAFAVKVASLDGGRGASMNGKIQKALQSTTSPTIEYQQTQPAALVRQEEQWTLTSLGRLSMAGQEQDIAVEVQLEKEGNTLLVKGSHPLKMRLIFRG